MIPRARLVIPIGAAMLAALLVTGAARAGEPASADSLERQPHPFVPGGYDDKPHLQGLFGRIAIGGYVEALGEWEREEGATSELGAQVRRWNLLAATDLRRRVQVWSEIEFEEGGEEVRVELAQIDVRWRREANARAGILLLPLGRFNLAHDAPRTLLPDRPLADERLLGVALSMPGFGGFGTFGAAGRARLTWELYGVTGFHDGLLLASAEGTRLPAGRINNEDANASPAWVGRLEWAAGRRAAIGVAGYRGAYNQFRLEGVDVDERRDVRIGVLDAESQLPWLAVSGEGVWVDVDLPPSFAGLFASRQSGGWLQLAHRLGHDFTPALAGSSLDLVVRGDAVDFDRDRAGDSERSVSVGLVARPVPETALKLAWVRGESRDRFDNRAAFARVQLALATYF